MVADTYPYPCPTTGDQERASLVKINWLVCQIQAQLDQLINQGVTVVVDLTAIEDILRNEVIPLIDQVQPSLDQQTQLLTDILAQLGGTPTITGRTVDFAFGTSYALPAGTDLYDVSIFCTSQTDPLYVLLFVGPAPPGPGQQPQFALRALPDGHVYYETHIPAIAGQNLYLETSASNLVLNVVPDQVYYAVSRST